MARAFKKNGTNIIVADKLSGYATSGGDVATGLRFDWVEVVVDTSLPGATASDQYTCDILFVNAGESLLVGWGDGSTDEYVYPNSKSQVHTYPTSGVYKVRYGRTNTTSLPIPVHQSVFSAGDSGKKTDITRFGEYSQVPVQAIGYGMTASGTAVSASDTPDGSVFAGPQTNMFGTFRGIGEPFTLPNTLTFAGPNILGNCRFTFSGSPNFNSSVGHLALTIYDATTMFSGCSSFDNGGSTDINNLTFDFTLPGGQSVNSTFRDCTVFNQPVGNWNLTGCNSLQQTFGNAQAFNQDIGSWDTSSVTIMFNLFAGAYAFNNGGSSSIGNWDLSNVGNMSGAFTSARAFNQDISNWTAGAKTLTPTNVGGCFGQAYDFNNGNADGVSNGSVGTGMDAWDIGACTTLIQTFRRAESFNTYIGSWDVGNITSMDRSFERAYRFNQDLSGWTFGASKLTNMRQAFNLATDFNNGGQPMDGWDVSGVTNFQQAFQDATSFNASCDWSLKTTGDINFTFAFLRASSFTGIGLENWNTERVTTFSQCFQETSLNFALTHPNYWEMRPGVNISSAFRNTPLNGGQASGVSGRNFEMRFSTSASDSYSLTQMFYGCADFNQDISTDATNNYWDVSRVTNMTAMFRFCSLFNQDIGNWDVSACTNMGSMFQNCTNFNQPIGNWGSGTASVTDMSLMFNGCTNFDQDLSGWSIASLQNASSFMVSANALSTANYDSVLDSTTGWASQATIQNNVGIHFGDAQYTAGGNAEAGRNILTGTYGWTISDGGPV